MSAVHQLVPTQRAPHVAAARTPYLDLDVPAAVTRYRRIAACLPGTAVHYPVRANPEPALLAALAAAGCRFDVAGPAEVVAVLRAGAAAGDLVYSSPVKRRQDIVFAARLGVRVFVVDSIEETQKVAAAAPGSVVLCRILTSEDGADLPLSRRYGRTPGQAVHILRSAAAVGLQAAGLSFHVGSQREPSAWDGPIAATARVFATLRVDGLAPWLLDLGGGFPARLDEGCLPLAAYGAAIETSLRRHFGDRRPATMVGPGRAVVADAGTLVASVVAVLWRGDTRWVFLDAGGFTGLAATRDEAMRYRITTTAVGGPTGPCVLAGPACRGGDVLVEQAPVQLPRALAEGDVVRLHASGAYPGVNGFPSLPTRLVGRG